MLNHAFIVAIEREQAMNFIKSLSLAGVALVVVSSVNAWSQTSDLTATTMQSGTPSASAGHAADASQIEGQALAKDISGVTSVKNVLTLQDGGQ